MSTCAAGDIRGVLDRLLEDVLALDESLAEVLPIRFDRRTGATFDLDAMPVGGRGGCDRPPNPVGSEVPGRGREWTLLGVWPERRA